MKKIFFALVVIIFLNPALNASIAMSSDLKSNAKQTVSFPLNDQRTRKIIEQEQLMKVGSGLVQQGHYEGAINEFKKAMSPELLLHDYDIEPPIFLMAKTMKLQGKYNEALSEIEDVLERHKGVREGNWHDEKLELEALIKARETNSAQPIYEHIAYLKKKYKNQLPPKRVFAGISEIVTSAIVRLYDHIGDCDAGIAFMDTFINYYARKWHINPENIGSKNQHLIVRKVFEQDKAEGFKGCINAKPGEVCMGRAAKALIQSDYFPW